MKNPNSIKSISIKLASPEEILEMSYGEVKTPATISYKNQQTDEDGLFSQRIFGPIKDYYCRCQKYKHAKDKGKICEVCDVEITKSSVRRDRFAHIKLAAPVAHIWMLRSIPSKISTFLDIKMREIEEIIYYVSYIVIDPGSLSDDIALGLRKKTIISQKSGRIVFHKILSSVVKKIKNNDFDDIPFLKELDKDNLNYIFVEIETYISELSQKSHSYSFEDILDFITDVFGAKIETGASALQKLIKEINIEKEIQTLKEKISQSKNSVVANIKRLAVIESFYNSPNKPEWMFLNVLPILPCGLRPIVLLSDGKYTASEINELYRRVIIRNSRLKEIIKKNPARIILNAEKRLLQDAVDALLDNERKIKPVVGKDKRPLKSLSSNLKGKRGRFRQNLLGKRVDYSARSVIVVGPELKMYQCGLPVDIVLELYKPFLISAILKSFEENFFNFKIIEKMILKKNKLIWSFLNDVIKKRPVLLNRAPTLHRLGIQAFEVVLIKGKAIQLHPLLTTAFNADFDGDQMAVHLPLSQKAIAEARSIMIGSNNIISPKDGKPIVTPSQDIILGIYYLTFEKKPKNIKLFSNYYEVYSAIENKRIKLHDLIGFSTDSSLLKNIVLKEQRGAFLITTPGKVIFNNIFYNMPNNGIFTNNNMHNFEKKSFFSFNNKNRDYVMYIKNTEELKAYFAQYELNDGFNNECLSKIVGLIYSKVENGSGIYLDKIKDIGFLYSTYSGITIAASDVQFKEDIFSKSDAIIDYKIKKVKIINKKIKKIEEFYDNGMVTLQNRKQIIINEWTKVKDDVQNFLKKYLLRPKMMKNPIYKISKSGARGNVSNLVQLSGIRGLMVSAKGDIIEIPIKSSFKEGLSMIEFFISTHGARKGMADTSLKTSDSGYLSRRLIDVAHDIVIYEEDCFTLNGFLVKNVYDTKTNSIIVELEERIIGRISLDDVFDKNNNIIVKKDELITKEHAELISLNKINEIMIRSVLYCESISGSCQKCFGLDLSTHKLVKIGTAVGIISAQSIGEPCTQLTMRTFHTGGVAGGYDITQGLPRIKELLDVIKPGGSNAIISEINGKVKEIKILDHGKKIVVLERKYYPPNSKKISTETKEYPINYGEQLRIKLNSKVKIGDKIIEGNIDLRKLLENTDVYNVQSYIIKEIERVYKSQGITISEKYIEVIVKKMLNKMRVVRPGDSKIIIGTIITQNKYKELCQKLINDGKKPIFGIPVLLGLKKAPLENDSFLSAASFQNTIKVLTNSAVNHSIDYLVGLKENVLVTKLIPAGTGLMTEDEIIMNGKKALEKQY